MGVDLQLIFADEIDYGYGRIQTFFIRRTIDFGQLTLIQ